MQSPLPPQIEGRTPEGELVPVGVLYTLKFPDLFKFSLFCEVKDGNVDACATYIYTQKCLQCLPEFFLNVSGPWSGLFVD